MGRLAILRNRINEFKLNSRRLEEEKNCIADEITELFDNIKEVSERYLIEESTPLWNKIQELFKEKQNIDKIYFTEENLHLKDAGIDELELSVRAYNVLKRRGIYTIGDLIEIGEKGAKRIRNMGKICAIEITEKLKEKGIDFTI